MSPKMKRFLREHLDRTIRLSGPLGEENEDVGRIVRDTVKYIEDHCEEIGISLERIQG